jgi:hypothetical protein
MKRKKIHYIILFLAEVLFLIPLLIACGYKNIREIPAWLQSSKLYNNKYNSDTYVGLFNQYDINNNRHKNEYWDELFIKMARHQLIDGKLYLDKVNFKDFGENYKTLYKKEVKSLLINPRLERECFEEDQYDRNYVATYRCYTIYSADGIDENLLDMSEYNKLMAEKKAKAIEDFKKRNREEQ